MSDLLESFREAYSNLQLLPLLTDENLEKFQVEYARETIEELEQLVEDSPPGSNKIIFAGHRGCGKSTLLAKLSRQLESRFFVVFFSISDMIEMSDVNHINILFAIGVQMMAKAENCEVEIDPSTKKQFYRWFATKTKTEIEQINAEASGGFNLFQFIAGKLKLDATVRNEIKEEFQRNISELVGRINEIAATIETASGKNILVIIDDLDKLDLGVVRTIYEEHVKALFQPNFRIIFTIPVSALREIKQQAILRTETNNQIEIMPVSKLFGKGERKHPSSEPKREPMAVLREAIAKRVKSELIEEETADKIILASGGVLRELIRITNQCCRICLRLVRRDLEDASIKINDEILQQAITKIRIDFDMGIGTADYQILNKVAEDFSPHDANEQRFLDLLHGLYVLEYRNDELWYDVHPIVIELLKQKGGA